MAANRTILPEDTIVAERLYAIYKLKKTALGINQSELAKQIGLTQPTVSQYFRGTIALRNAKTLAAFAKALQVSPEEIDPTFEAREARRTPQNVKAFTETATRENIAIRLIAKENDLVAFVSGKDTEPYFAQGTIFLGDKSMLLTVGKWVLILLHEEKRALLRTLENVTARQITVSHLGKTESYTFKDIEFAIPVSHIQL